VTAIRAFALPFGHFGSPAITGGKPEEKLAQHYIICCFGGRAGLSCLEVPVIGIIELG
jgi:hypothetical protein